MCCQNTYCSSESTGDRRLNVLENDLGWDTGHNHVCRRRNRVPSVAQSPSPALHVDVFHGPRDPEGERGEAKPATAIRPSQEEHHVKTDVLEDRDLTSAVR